MDPNKLYKFLLKMTDGRLSEKHRAVIYRWLLNGDENKDKTLQEIWDMPSLVSDEETQKALREFQRRIGEQGEEHSHIKLAAFRLLKFAAVALLLIAGGITLWKYSEYYHSNEAKLITCTVPEGQTRKVILSDSSVVLLSGGSRLVYPETFSKYQRRELFLSGEAHFAITHDEKHPFTVNVDNISIKVLGTDFNVRAYPDEDDVITTLERGSVKMVHEGVDSLLLRPNEQAIYNRYSKKLTSKAVDSKHYSSWTSGKMEFHYMPLKYVLAELRHRYGVTFIVDKGIDLDKRYRMDFKANEDLNTILLILGSVSEEFTAQKNKNTVKLIKNRKEV